MYKSYITRTYNRTGCGSTDSWTGEKKKTILPSFSYLLTLVDPGDADVAPITVFASVVWFWSWRVLMFTQSVFEMCVVLCRLSHWLYH